ncbi:hypothetical protein ACVR0A_02440 [Streptococcus downei]|uniref:Membrane protein n=1 Tax=Streptococcus downei MFe28 TaxID=764290 RepID=A0A380JGC9_STRDO|nr:hypothetical protein [Streptococcus downei]EFQ57538.1 hypothetical protein HMPREF9176_1598 [Streptococcus downei F0415]SUN36411.1 membrane protein [Streptococcus downei MFe28]
MKKSFFQRTYNLVNNLLLLGFLSVVISLAMSYLSYLIGEISISSLTSEISLIQSKLNIAEYYTDFIGTILIIIAIFLITTELSSCLFYDSIWNYFKSIYQTMRLRHFLKQDEKTESVITVDNQTTVTKFNPILKNFNKIVSKCTVDVRKESVSVFIKYPSTQQAQKLLREMEAHIKEEISSRNPNYYFSSPNREGNKLWFKGTRR